MGEFQRLVEATTPREEFGADTETEQLRQDVAGSAQLEAAQNPVFGLLETTERVQRLSELACGRREPGALAQLLELINALPGGALRGVEITGQRLDLPSSLHHNRGPCDHSPFAHLSEGFAKQGSCFCVFSSIRENEGLPYGGERLETSVLLQFLGEPGQGFIKWDGSVGDSRSAKRRGVGVHPGLLRLEDMLHDTHQRLVRRIEPAPVMLDECGCDLERCQGTFVLAPFDDRPGLLHQRAHLVLVRFGVEVRSPYDADQSRLQRPNPQTGGLGPIRCPVSACDRVVQPADHAKRLDELFLERERDLPIRKQEFRTLQQVDRCAGVTPLQRAPACGLQSLGACDCDRAGHLVHRAQLGAIPECLLQVIARDLVQFLEVRAVLDEPVGKPRVQLSTLCFGQ